MREKNERAPRLSAREMEDKRLRAETNGIFAPAKPGFYSEKRRELVEQYVQEGLEKFDAQQESSHQLEL